MWNTLSKKIALISVSSRNDDEEQHESQGEESAKQNSQPEK